MTRLFLPLLLCAVPALAQSTTEELIASVNQAIAADDAQAFAGLFTADGDLWRAGKRAGSGRDAIRESFRPRGIWRESMTPRITSASVRLIAPDAAVVESLHAHASVVIIATRRSAVWRIVTMLIMIPDPMEIRPAASRTPPHSQSPPQSAATKS
jgi:uncharacterized protein (TIGR02246 family)